MIVQSSCSIPPLLSKPDVLFQMNYQVLSNDQILDICISFPLSVGHFLLIVFLAESFLFVLSQILAILVLLILHPACHYISWQGSSPNGFHLDSSSKYDYVSYALRLYSRYDSPWFPCFDTAVPSDALATQFPGLDMTANLVDYF